MNFNQVRLLLLPFAASGILVGAAILSGCVEQPPEVTVSLKPADEAAVATAPGETPTAVDPAAPVETGAAGGVGDLVGTIVFDGTPPTLEPLVKAGDAAARDAAVCAQVEIPNESLEVDAATKGIKSVFIYLEKAPAGVPASAPSGEVVFDQKGCKFLPHVLLMQTNQTVLVKSQDSVAHNTHTFPARNTAFNSAIKVNESIGVPLVYKRPEKDPVEVKCDFHPWMRAFHLPLDHGFAAVTDASGKFEIKGLPAGDHTFKVWHEKGGVLERGYKVTIKGGGPNELNRTYGAAKFAAFQGPAPRTVVIGRSGLPVR